MSTQIIVHTHPLKSGGSCKDALQMVAIMERAISYYLLGRPFTNVDYGGPRHKSPFHTLIE